MGPDSFVFISTISVQQDGGAFFIHWLRHSVVPSGGDMFCKNGNCGVHPTRTGASLMGW